MIEEALHDLDWVMAM
jgi:hypothetical protein